MSDRRLDKHQHRTSVFKYRAMWVPTCDCGWEGIPLRSEEEAEQECNDHIVAATRGA